MNWTGKESIVSLRSFESVSSCRAERVQPGLPHGIFTKPKWMPLPEARLDVPGRQARVVKRDRSREEESE